MLVNHPKSCTDRLNCKREHAGVTVAPEEIAKEEMVVIAGRKSEARIEGKA
jgi:hypothetical protein